MRRPAPLALAAGLALAAATTAYLLWLPDVRPLKRRNPKTTAYIAEYERAHRAKARQLWVGWDDISDNLKNAVLTSEDDMFYRHQGVDWDAMRVALEKDLDRRAFAYGASTITQQVARNLYLSPSKNPLRKVKEILIARRLERELGKRRIFELYLNIAEWGKGLYGCEAAAQAYFGKHASELTPDEAVALAVVLPSPRRHDPAKRGRYVERNMRRVMARMRASGFLPEEDDVELSTAAVAASTAAVQASTQAVSLDVPSTKMD